MDTGSIKPQSRLVRTSLARAPGRSVLASAETELSPSRSVTAAVDTGNAPRHRGERDNAALLRAAAEAVIDPRTQEAIERAASTSPTDDQKTAEAKLRAYRLAEREDGSEMQSVQKTV